MRSLSEQQLVDCSKAEGNQGCQGGKMTNAFGWIATNGGIDSESDYPYASEVCARDLTAPRGCARSRR